MVTDARKIYLVVRVHTRKGRDGWSVRQGDSRGQINRDQNNCGWADRIYKL
ncbi:MAG: hypothetical protein K0R52_1094 [Alphaproteobacteria bacterium]|jgi:hypothetical protein|nr:hypothetical protein [Alphaproteobacteria bacterium]